MFYNTLSRAAEGTGPMKPGNLTFVKVLNPAEISGR